MWTVQIDVAWHTRRGLETTDVTRRGEMLPSLLTHLDTLMLQAAAWASRQERKGHPWNAAMVVQAVTEASLIVSSRALRTDGFHRQQTQGPNEDARSSGD